MAGRRKKETSDEELEAMVASGQAGAYEALQLYRSRSNRLKVKGDIDGAVRVAARGAKLLCAGFEKAGMELTSLLIETLTEAEQDCTPENRGLINDIDAAFPEKSALRIDFLMAAIKWTMKCGPRQLGDPMLHSRLAVCLWNTSLPAERIKAVYHFSVAEMPEALCASIVNDCSGEEREQLLAFAITQMLALESIRDAVTLLADYKNSMKGEKQAISELVKFSDYLLQVCKRDAAPLFQTLVQTYSPLLETQPHMANLVYGPIASKYFNLRPQQEQNMMSMLQNMMGGGMAY